MKAFHIVGPAPLCTNTFLLVTDAGHAVAIDPAADASLYEQALEQTGAKLTHILCTHGHYDHVGAVKSGAARCILILPMPKATAAFP